MSRTDRLGSKRCMLKTIAQDRRLMMVIGAVLIDIPLSTPIKTNVTIAETDPTVDGTTVKDGWTRDEGIHYDTV